jgi:hypothetical protein
MVVDRVLVFVGCGLFVGVMLFLHVVRRDLSPLNRGMSRYAGPPTLALATLAFLALAGTVGAFSAGLDQQGRRVALVAAAGLVVVAATPIGQPATPVVTLLHAVGGVTFYLGIIGVMFIAPARAPGEQILRWSLVGALTLFCAGAFGVPGLRLVVGLLQRVVFALIMLWLLSRARS